MKVLFFVCVFERNGVLGSFGKWGWELFCVLHLFTILVETWSPFCGHRQFSKSRKSSLFLSSCYYLASSCNTFSHNNWYQSQVRPWLGNWIHGPKLFDSPKGNCRSTGSFIYTFSVEVHKVDKDGVDKFKFCSGKI